MAQNISKIICQLAHWRPINHWDIRLFRICQIRLRSKNTFNVCRSKRNGNVSSYLLNNIKWIEFQPKSALKLNILKYQSFRRETLVMRFETFKFTWKNERWLLIRWSMLSYSCCQCWFPSDRLLWNIFPLYEKIKTFLISQALTSLLRLMPNF